MREVEIEKLGHRMCPWCRKPTVMTRLEIWFGRFRHVEKVCHKCGYYKYM